MTTPTSTSTADSPLTWEELRSRHLLAGLLRQERLVTVLAGNPWTLDLETGIAEFGPHRTRISFLGNASYQAGTWRWGWAMADDGIAPDRTQASARARALGDAHGITELTTTDLPLEDFDPFEVALIAAGIAGGTGIYRGPHPDGAVLFTVDDIALPPLDLAVLPRVLSEVITSYDVDHRTAIGCAATDSGFVWLPAQLDATRRTAQRGSEEFTVEFDDLGRLCQLSAHVGM